MKRDIHEISSAKEYYARSNYNHEVCACDGCGGSFLTKTLQSVHLGKNWTFAMHYMVCSASCRKEVHRQEQTYRMSGKRVWGCLAESFWFLIPLTMICEDVLWISSLLSPFITCPFVWDPAGLYKCRCRRSIAGLRKGTSLPIIVLLDGCASALGVDGSASVYDIGPYVSTPHGSCSLHVMCNRMHDDMMHTWCWHLRSWHSQLCTCRSRTSRGWFSLALALRYSWKVKKNGAAILYGPVCPLFHDHVYMYVYFPWGSEFLAVGLSQCNCMFLSNVEIAVLVRCIWISSCFSSSSLSGVLLCQDGCAECLRIPDTSGGCDSNKSNGHVVRADSSHKEWMMKGAPPVEIVGSVGVASRALVPLFKISP